MQNETTQPSYNLLNVSVTVWEKAPRVFSAEAVQGTRKGFGQGSSADVAGARAMQFLLKVVVEEEGLEAPPPPAENAFAATHMVMAGRMFGHKCMLVSTKAEFVDGTKLYAVVYDDSSVGDERSQFLNELKKA